MGHRQESTSGRFILAAPRAGAVWFGGVMGLLDDAIREHLELKRLKGADPGAVAREEQDALGPIHREGEAGRGEGAGEQASPDAHLSVSSGAESATGDSSGATQETIEMNMEAELAATEQDPRHEQEAVPPKRAAPVAHPERTPIGAEESLEWEVPDRRQEEQATSTELGAEAESRVEDDEHVEDVLEETPDFLRDTPEQERLWFEQRPPRDFDFNE